MKVVLKLAAVSFLCLNCSWAYKLVVMVNGILPGSESMVLLVRQVEQQHPGTRIYNCNGYSVWYSLESTWEQVQELRDFTHNNHNTREQRGYTKVTGTAQIISGISLLWGNIGYYGILQNNLWIPPIILLSLGPLTIILCWLGCQATNQKKRCMLGMFSALLAICICFQFIVCGWALSMTENLPTSVELFVDDSFVEFLDKFSRTKVDNLDLWNRMQSQLQCCGVDGPLDYRRLSLPWSCCSRAKHAYETACDTHYKRGCLGVLSELIKIRLQCSCFAAIIIAILQSLGLFCTIHLTILIGKNNFYKINRLKPPQDHIQLSIQDKRKTTPSPLSLSPSAPGHRLIKNAPPPPPELSK